MTPRQLKAFVTVAQTLSFARASEQLHLSQPALSLAIRGLETALGGPLFSRTTRQVRLTPEGAALLPQALQLQADWENVRHRLMQHFTLQRGHVAIAAMPSFAGAILPDILRRYRQQFPNVEISVHDVVHEQVVEMVTNGRVELGFCFELGTESQLAFEPLYDDRFIAIVSTESELAKLRQVSWAQLSSQRFISLQRPALMRHLLETSLAEKGMTLHVALECNQLATACQWVAAGLGVSVVPSFLERQVTAIGVRVLRLVRPTIRKPIGLITLPHQQLSAAAEAIRKIVREVTWKHRRDRT